VNQDETDYGSEPDGDENHGLVMKNVSKIFLLKMPYIFLLGLWNWTFRNQEKQDQ
jgi:hypothetical protein